MGSISTRKYIKWEGQEASEPTSTIVLTSPGRRYVDLRILTDGPDDGPILPLARLDWAIAGFSSSQLVESRERREQHQQQRVYHAQWLHWIDSRTRNADGASDSGYNYPQEGGDLTLEKGTMVDPATGRERAYEELWHDARPTKGVNLSDRTASLVLVWEGAQADQRGMLVRVGEWCQGLVRNGADIAMERWRRESAGAWGLQRRITSGRQVDGRIPSEEATGARAWAVGDTVVREDATWTVVEYEEA